MAAADRIEGFATEGEAGRQPFRIILQDDELLAQRPPMSSGSANSGKSGNRDPSPELCS
jgi:hypothetical protein